MSATQPAYPISLPLINLKMFAEKKCVSRFEKVLTMVYNTQNYWVFGLSPLPRILRTTKEHDVSETGSVSILRWRGEKTRTLLCPLERSNLNQWIPDDGQSPKTQQFWRVCKS
jgi:hypothetical protein